MWCMVLIVEVVLASCLKRIRSSVFGCLHCRGREDKKAAPVKKQSTKQTPRSSSSRSPSRRASSSVISTLQSNLLSLSCISLASMIFFCFCTCFQVTFCCRMQIWSLQRVGTSIRICNWISSDFLIVSKDRQFCKAWFLITSQSSARSFCQYLNCKPMYVWMQSRKSSATAASMAAAAGEPAVDPFYERPQVPSHRNARPTFEIEV